MDLRKRLASLDRLTRKPQIKPEAGPVPHKSAPPDLLREMGLRPLDSRPDCAWILEGQMDCPKFAASTPHLEGFFTRAQEAQPEHEDILFLDTETTGLVGGTGTIAFLVGVGWWAHGRFLWRQYLLPDFSAEASLLADLRELASRFSVVMTFNGASFDLPLLRTRALMNRLPDPCGDLVSWDLLVPGRRIWGRSLPDCRQQTLENHLLTGMREGVDIDGALIPQVWFDFLRDGRHETMDRVLYHNQQDLLGMAGIYKQVLDICCALSENPDGIDHSFPWRLCWSLGRIAEIQRHQERAAGWILEALAGAPPAARGEKRLVADSVRILKRRGHWLQVDDILQDALRAGLDEAWVHREAAILHEHRLGNVEKALEHARLSEEPHRIERLEGKLIRQQGRK